MKKMIMTLMMVLSMTIGANAQRLDNTYMEARILTDYMADELSLNSWQREKAYQMNLDYLNGIGSYRDIDAHIWTLRNNQLKSILNAASGSFTRRQATSTVQSAGNKAHTYTISTLSTLLLQE